MKLDYGTQLSRKPIKLSIGTIKKPTLDEISEITFGVFEQYESMLKMKPEFILSQFVGDEGKSIWEMLPEEERRSIDMLDVLSSNEVLANEFVKVLRFFFIEPIIFSGGKFILLNCEIKHDCHYADEEIRGCIDKTNFSEVIDIIEQICCIDNKDDEHEMKFKNERARKLYEKMKHGKTKSAKKADFNYTIPNLISAVCSMHNSINPINVWELTIFQLLDQFNRLTTNAIYQIEQTRVSVWGDEKKTFDVTLWYKNEFDKK